MPDVHINLGERSYDVVVGAGVLADLGVRAAALVPGRHAFLILDDKLPEETVLAAAASLDAAGFTVTRATVTALEVEKSLETVKRLLGAVGGARLERRDPVIALGGGITGDVGGFVAASYRRGIPVIQCPTTLLSMVDASVGGKTGVNLEIEGGLKKNMVGAFWQPRLVLADINTLRSLPARERRAGLAECLKHGLLCGESDGELFDWTIEHLGDIDALNMEVLTELVSRNVHVKAAVVVADEREEAGTGGRALLNLGHTFGHAIEPMKSLSPDGDAKHAPLLHGEAVGYGMMAAARAARLLGRIDDEAELEIRNGVGEALELRPLGGLPESSVVLDAMQHDKKVSGGRLRLVLPVGGRRCATFDDVDAGVIAAAIDSLRE